MSEPVESTSRSSKAVAILVYSLLRLGLFAVVWLVIEFLTPVHGLFAAAAAILISGAISVVVLDRQRGAVGAAAAGFFGRINSRIEASARAEDDEGARLEQPDAGDAVAVVDSGEPEDESEHKAVGQE